MRLDVKRQLFARSERVKGIDFHDTEPWILTTLYNGHAHIWSYETQAIIKSYELTDVPIRAGRFICRKNWICVGSDDFKLRITNYNTGEKVKTFEAHPDYIRAIAVHPTLPYVLTASDDMTIRMWDWDAGWAMKREFVGHAHYVMSLAFNPKDTNTFASACLDRTVKIWSLDKGTPNQTIEAHETKGVNYVDYYPHADKPYLITTSDDKTCKIWDYQTKGLVASLEGHTANVSFAVYSPQLPIIVSGSEDGTVKIWHANTYRLEQSLSYGLERAWCVSVQRGKQGIAMGFDDGAVVVKMGREEPAVSMDSTGKLIWTKVNEVLSGVVRGDDPSLKDGAPIAISAKELGNIEVYASSLQHSPSGRFVAICGDGEYLIYTALAFRQQGFGKALDFVWSASSNNDYAIRESSTSVKIFKKLKEKGPLDVGFSAEGLAGGTLLGVKGQGGVGFFDWDSGALVRRIEVDPREVIWSESGELVALCCADSTYVLRFNREAYVDAISEGQADEDGVEAAFELLHEMSDVAVTAHWVGDSLVYTTEARQLKQLIGEQTDTIAHFDQGMYVLRYLPRDGRLYLCDKDMTLMSYTLSTNVVEYQTLVLRGDLDAAQSLLADIPAPQMNKIARFLEGQGHKELALEVATDPEHRFELALALNNLQIGLEIARQQDTEHKYKTVGDAAMAGWDLETAEEMFVLAKDIGSLLLLYTSSGDKEKLLQLAAQAEDAGSHNIAFGALWSAGDVDGAIGLLQRTGRMSEAVLLSHTYKPSKTQQLATEWKESLDKKGKSKVSRLIGVPGDDEDLFPEWDEYLKLEAEGKTGKLVDLDGAEPATNGVTANGHAEVDEHEGEEVEEEEEEAS